MKKIFVSAVLAVTLLSGCASGVNRGQSPAAAQGIRTAPQPVASVSLSFTDEGKQAASENLKFNSEELRNHVKRALEANSLLTAGAEKPASELEIQVKGVRIRSSFSAVMWGFMAGADSVTADIVLKEPGGKEIDRYEVSVSYALGGIAGGQDGARMGWLYEKFAEETVKELKRP